MKDIKVNVSLLALSVILINSIMAQTTEYRNQNLEDYQKPAAEYSIPAADNNNKVVEEIKQKLDKKYASKSNFDSSKESISKEESSTGWTVASAPYGCTAWQIIGSDSRRTCTVKENRSVTAYDKNEEFGYVSNIEVKFEERERQITQLKSKVAPTERFLVNYEKGFGTPTTNNGGNTPPGQNKQETLENQGTSGEILITLTMPETAKKGQKFNVAWEASNADWCDFSLLSGDNNGTSFNKELQINVLNTYPITLTCGNNSQEKEEKRTLVVEKATCPAIKNYRPNMYLNGKVQGMYSGRSWIYHSLPETVDGGSVEVSETPYKITSGASCGTVSVYLSGRYRNINLYAVIMKNRSYCDEGVWKETDYYTSCQTDDYYYRYYRIRKYSTHKSSTITNIRY